MRGCARRDRPRISLRLSGLRLLDRVAGSPHEAKRNAGTRGEVAPGFRCAPSGLRLLARIVERRGWTLLRVSGSHHIYGKPGSIVKAVDPDPRQQGAQDRLVAAFAEGGGDSEGGFVAQAAAANALSLSPPWERVASRSDSEGEPGEGAVPQLKSAPSPDLARLRLRSVTLSHKGRGKRVCRAAVL